jgi:6-phosphogluconolactonase/glucosamine-6-phosphate isomerase/deaminase
VSGKGKEEMLKDVFSGESGHPCAAVRPTEGNLTWIIGD